jgi:hypothetical protein
MADPLKQIYVPVRTGSEFLEKLRKATKGWNAEVLFEASFSPQKQTETETNRNPFNPKVFLPG